MLKKGYSRKSISANIRMEMKKHPKMPQRQAVAIAMSTARKAAKAAGKRGPVQARRRKGR